MADRKAEQFDPRSQQAEAPQLRLTERAIGHLKRQLQRSPGNAVRLAVKESGCNGYMYELDYIEAPSAEERACEIDQELKLYVHQQHIPLLRGTEIDYVSEGLNAALKFDNPNAEAACGCGESFSVAKE